MPPATAFPMDHAAASSRTSCVSSASIVRRTRTTRGRSTIFRIREFVLVPTLVTIRQASFRMCSIRDSRALTTREMTRRLDDSVNLVTAAAGIFSTAHREALARNQKPKTEQEGAQHEDAGWQTSASANATQTYDLVRGRQFCMSSSKRSATTGPESKTVWISSPSFEDSRSLNA
jgi:hypothetical protein